MVDRGAAADAAMTRFHEHLMPGGVLVMPIRLRSLIASQLLDPRRQKRITPSNASRFIVGFFQAVE